MKSGFMDKLIDRLDRIDPKSLQTHFLRLAQEKGLIETSWLDVPPTSERSFGIFGREGFGNNERARMTVSVKRMDDVASVSVLETRQRWHSRGGVTSQALKWWAIDPSEEVTDDVVDRLNARLKAKGCAPA